MDSFAVSHQLVSLDIDFSRRAVKGVTELSIRPKTGDFRGLRLHCDRPVVRSVTVDGLACSFESVGPTTRQQVLDSISQNDNNNNNSSSDDDDEGGGGGRRGLIIRFPSEFTATTTTSSSTTTSTTSTNDEVGVLFKQCKVRIEFYLVDSQTGLVFDGTTAYTETRVYPVSVTRAWLPCVDTMHERSTWDLFYTVPAVVPASEGGEEEGVMSCVTVVSVGELTSLVVHPRDATKKIFRYVMSTATPACTLGFAAGPFTSACTLGSSELRQKPPLAAAAGVDVGAFAEQWVYGTGCPVLHVACAFNRKKLAVEITVHQESTNARATAPWVRPQQLFRGPLTARIREADGTPYEHVLDIGERVRRFEVQFNTKYKRIRRATKRFHTRQHDQVLIGAESPRAKRAWRAVEWGEADAESLASAAFEWIRVDPDQEWACVVHFAQPAFMWAAQLQRDRDVAAQADAVAALQRLPSAAASTALMRAVMDARMFFRVRVAAALALAVLATERLAWIGLHHLVQIYAARYSSAGDPGADLGSSPIIPRPNDFRDFGEYFTQRAVLAALSNVRGGGRRGGGSGGGGGNNGGVAPAPARRVLLAALRYNDNSANAYADGHYLAGLAAAVANSVVCGGDDDSSSSSSISATLAALAEVERLRALDVLVPSFHNVVTCAALDAVVRVSLAQPRLHVFNAALFAAANGRHAFDAVRRVAACGLLLHWGPRTPQCARMLAASAADARHPRVAAALARAAAQLMMLQAAALGRSPLAHNRSLMAEASASASVSAETKEWDEHVDAPARLVGGFEALVDDALGDSLELRVILASAAYDSALPPDTRRMLAAIHALVYQTVDESVPQKPQKPRPRLKIRLQPKTQPKPLPSEELPPKKGGSPMSSDSEDTPLGALLGVVATSAAAAAPPPPLPLPLKPPRRKYQRKAPLLQRPSAAMVSDELVSIDDDDDDDNAPLMLPAIAGTRPPPLVSPDASLNSPVYAGGAPPIKLKLKLSKVASSAVIDTISSSAGGGGGSPLSKEIPREKEIPRDVSKEKEIPPTLTIPPPPPSLPPPIPPPLLPPQPSVAPVAPTDSLHASSLDDPTRKHLHRVLRKFSRHPDAFPFTRPVDILLDGCPTYYDVIKQPMDLSTIKRNLE
ncbi:hypothetical protein GGF44_000997, partial [Coemansia sp. RSA 1694]